MAVGLGALFEDAGVGDFLVLHVLCVVPGLGAGGGKDVHGNKLAHSDGGGGKKGGRSIIIDGCADGVPVRLSSCALGEYFASVLQFVRPFGAGAATRK